MTARNRRVLVQNLHLLLYPTLSGRQKTRAENMTQECDSRNFFLAPVACMLGSLATEAGGNSGLSQQIEDFLQEEGALAQGKK